MGIISHVWAQRLLLKYQGSRGLRVRHPPEESPRCSVSLLADKLHGNLYRKW